MKGKLNDNPKITNFDRLLDDPDVRNFLGVELDENGEVFFSISEPEAIKGLTKLASDLVEPDFKVNKIYSKEDRKKYIDNFDEAAKPNHAIKAAARWKASSVVQPTTEQPAPTQPTRSEAKIRVRPTERKKLIPKNCKINISNPRVNKIYDELMRIEISRYPNAVSVLLRVFIELSCDCYVESQNVTFKQKPSKTPTLGQKVTAVSEDLVNKDFIKESKCKGIRVAVSDQNSQQSIDTLHSYVHNRNFSPTNQNLTVAWDNIQEFMTCLWNNQ